MAVQSEEPTLLEVSKDKLEILVHCDFGPELLGSESETALKDNIHASLSELGVSSAASDVDLANWLRTKVQDEKNSDPWVLFRGTPATPAVNGHIKWEGNFFEKGYKVDADTGKIDYRSPLAETTVPEGKLLAILMPPQKGEPGMDVFGKKIDVKKPRSAKLNAGRNVTRTEDDKFYAEHDGRIAFAGGKLHVDDVYTIQGDVSLETGHISHPGAVVVNGDILEGSLVEVQGDIEVTGIVERCTIRTPGNVTVGGGVIGDDSCSVEIGGTLEAHFILDAHVTAGEGVAVAKEIVNSHVRTLGTLLVPQGRIVGGTSEALGGIIAKELGSEQAIKTTLICGLDYELTDQLTKKEAAAKELEDQKGKILSILTPLAGKMQKLPPDKKEAVTKLAEQLKGLIVQIEEVQREIEELGAESKDRARLRVIVRETAHPDTVVTLQKETRTVDNSVKGPMEFTLQKSRVTISSTNVD
jgi:hypothetical protein